jgi:hypothetical protein
VERATKPTNFAAKNWDPGPSDKMERTASQRVKAAAAKNAADKIPKILEVGEVLFSRSTAARDKNGSVTRPLGAHC